MCKCNRKLTCIHYQPTVASDSIFSKSKSLSSAALLHKLFCAPITLRAFSFLSPAFVLLTVFSHSWITFFLLCAFFAFFFVFWLVFLRLCLRGKDVFVWHSSVAGNQVPARVAFHSWQVSHSPCEIPG